MHSDDNFPKISIITPNFNGGQYLEDTIISVIDQDYPNLEYIIIDGGSTDNSIEIIKKYENKLAYWISEPDKGLYDAIQKGFSKSSGEIMAWLNSDDMYYHKSLFVVAELFSSNKQINWLQGTPTIFDEFGRTVYCAHSKKWSKYDYYLYKYEWIQQESIFWRRCLWEKVGSSLNTQLKLAGDLDLWLRFFRYDKLYVTSALLGGFRQRANNQLSLNEIDRYVYEANELIRKEPLTKYDKRLVLMYNILSKLISFVNYSKVLNLNFVARYFEHKFFNYPPSIVFDRRLQKFILNE